MNIELFLANLVIALGVIALAMLYLRHATRRVILELCHTEAGAEFRLRSTDILAYSGALVLVLCFGDSTNIDWVNSVRITLILTLGGLFFTVMWAASNVWRTLGSNTAAAAAQEARA